MNKHFTMIVCRIRPHSAVMHPMKPKDRGLSLSETVPVSCTPSPEYGPEEFFQYIPLQAEHRQAHRGCGAFPQLVFRIVRRRYCQGIAEFVPAAQVDGEICFPVIVHDPAEDRCSIQFCIVPVTQRDRSSS